MIKEELQFTIHQCQNAMCAFRFPMSSAEKRVSSCPMCGGALAADAMFTPADVTLANDNFPDTSSDTFSVSLLLDNLRSVYNVGSIFRTADGAGVHHVYLCGMTPTPKHRQLAKTALGAEEAISWSYHRNALSAVRQLQAAGTSIWALERFAHSVSLFDFLAEGRCQCNVPREILLVLGNENAGVDPAILACADRVVHLPMMGMKESLNVTVACGIALYYMGWMRR